MPPRPPRGHGFGHHHHRPRHHHHHHHRPPPFPMGGHYHHHRHYRRRGCFGTGCMTVAMALGSIAAAIVILL